MTATTAPAATAATSSDPVRRVPTERLLLRMHVRWVRWVWAISLVLLPLALAIIAVAGGDLTESLWAGGGIGWQRWVLFAAGIPVATSFLRQLVSRGVTRKRLAGGAVVAMLALTAIGAAVGIAGYLIEWAVFRWQDWPQQLPGGDTFSAGNVPRLAVEYWMLGAVFHLAGWLIGAAFARHRWTIAIVFIPLCFVPVALVELSVSRNTGNLRIDALPDPITDPAMLLTSVVAVGVIATAGYVATRVTRTLALR